MLQIVSYTTKVCSNSQCTQKNPQILIHFNKNKSSKDGYQNQCRVCHKISQVRWEKTHKEARRKTRRLRAKQRRIENYTKESLIRRKQQLRANFSLTIAQYNKMFADQNGQCAICQKHQSAFKKAFAVDHCHKTGQIRKLLCGACNPMLGLAQDSVDILNKAISYLRNFNDYEC